MSQQSRQLRRHESRLITCQENVDLLKNMCGVTHAYADAWSTAELGPVLAGSYTQAPSLFVPHNTDIFRSFGRFDAVAFEIDGRIKIRTRRHYGEPAARPSLRMHSSCVVLQFVVEHEIEIDFGSWQVNTCLSRPLPRTR